MKTPAAARLFASVGFVFLAVAVPASALWPTASSVPLRADGLLVGTAHPPVLGLDAPSPWLVVGLGLVVVGTTIVRRLVKSPSARHLAN